MSFSAFALSPQTLRAVRDRGYNQPTPIQSAAIPVALGGRDLVATAGTGSGKTMAFLLPLLERFQTAPTGGIRALILAPTRELAAQINHEFGLVARHTRLRAALIVGGESMSRQEHELRSGAQVVIACPGRLIDHMERGLVRLDRVDLVVIDEADRLLDMGFLPQLRRILRTAHKPRQTLMFSATMDPAVEQVAREFLSKPERVTVGPASAPPESIRQAIYPVAQEHKGPMLLELLGRAQVGTVIVFTRTKSRADRVTKILVRSRVKAVVIHGGRSQSQRNAALAGFRRGDYKVLVATDVAARGLDIPDVSHVINFDLPETSDSYIHRIGRTARMGKAGQAISLVMPEDGAYLRDIERVLGGRLERANVEGFPELEIASEKPKSVSRTSVRHFSPSLKHRRARGHAFS